MERDVLLIGTMIAVLRKDLNIINVKKQIAEGMRIARSIGVDEAIAKEAGEEPTNEEPICEVNKLTTSSSYQTVVSKTVTKTRTARIAKMEMACREDADYDSVQWRLTINSKIVLEDKTLPASLTLDLSDLSARGGKEFKIEAKATSGTPSVWGDITGKEII